MKEEIYVSVDIEADGPVPGKFSMLSLGAAAFKKDATLLDTFSVNLETLPDATQDPDTMQFWERNPEAWEQCHIDVKPPSIAMPEFRTWLEQLPGTPVFVGYPATFDWQFCHWYLVIFAGGDPMGFNAIDIKTYAMAMLKKDFKKTRKAKMPKRWFNPLKKHNHVAVDDAVEQGEIFIKMLAENTKEV